MSTEFPMGMEALGFPPIDRNRASFDAFIDPDGDGERTLGGLLGRWFPIVDFREEQRFELSGWSLEAPELDPEACAREGRTWAATVRLRLRFEGLQGPRDETLDLFTLPLLTEAGAFILEGVSCMPALAMGEDSVGARLAAVLVPGMSRTVRGVKERMAMLPPEQVSASACFGDRYLIPTRQTLLGREGAPRPMELRDGRVSFPVRLVHRPGLPAGVVLGRAFAQGLSTERLQRLEALSSAGPHRPCAWPPGLVPGEGAPLGDDGLPPIGRTLGAGEPLFAVSSPEFFLRAPTWPTLSEGGFDYSTYVPPGHGGEVVRVDGGRRPVVTLAATHTLGEGDALIAEAGQTLRVLALRDGLSPEVDGEWSGPSGTVRFCWTGLAAAELRVCGGGPEHVDGRLPDDLAVFGASSWPLAASRRALQVGATTLARERLGLDAEAPLVEGLKTLLLAARLQLVADPRGLRLGPIGDAAVRAQASPCGAGTPRVTEVPGLPPVVMYFTATDLDAEAVFGAPGAPDALRRLGYIDLCAPVLHPWFEGEVADRLGRSPEELLAMPAAALRTALEAADAPWPLVDLLIGALPVPPPPLSPRVGPLRDAYRKLINVNMKLVQLTRLNAPEVLLDNERRALRQKLHVLFEVPQPPRPGARAGAPLMRQPEGLLTALSGWSARVFSPLCAGTGAARVVASGLEGLQPGRCLVPEAMWRALAPGDNPLVLAPPEAGPRAFSVTPWSAPVIALHPQDHAALGSPERVFVHRPGTPAAAAEAMKLNGASRVESPQSWLLTLLAAPSVEGLREAALSQRGDDLGDPAARLLLG